MCIVWQIISTSISSLLKFNSVEIELLLPFWFLTLDCPVPEEEEKKEKLRKYWYKSDKKSQICQFVFDVCIFLLRNYQET